MQPGVCQVGTRAAACCKCEAVDCRARRMRAFTRGPRLVRPAVRHRLAQARMCKSGGGARARRPLGGAGQPGRPVRDHGALVRRAAGPAHAARQHAVAARPQPGLRRPARRGEPRDSPHASDERGSERAAAAGVSQAGAAELPSAARTGSHRVCGVRWARIAAICAATGALLRGPLPCRCCVMRLRCHHARA